MRTALAVAAWLFAFAAFALTLPALTGRVVDDANVLSQDTRVSLTTKLATLEQKSGIQLVVATVPSLQGQEIEPFANDLFRAWKLGESTKNNGVLFLIAPTEHRVRIEVGYGLEGTLTDAISKLIIANAVAPRFKAGDFNGGATRGVDDIITTLTTDASEWQQRPEFRPKEKEPAWVGPVFLVIFILIFALALRYGRRTGLNGPIILGSMLNSGFRSGGGGGWSGGGGGGFSGGGGSSGGGGASGSW